MIRAPVNTLKLYSWSAVYNSTDKSYNYKNLTLFNGETFKWLRVRAFDFATSNKTFDNEVLVNTNTTSPTNILDGDYDSLTLPAVLQTIFAANSVAIPLATNVISIAFAGAVTLNISQWGIRARRFLGAGDADLSLLGAGTITFPYVCNLGGDMEYSFQFSNHLSDINPVVALGNAKVSPEIPPDPTFVFTVPADTDMSGFVCYRPENYIMKAPTSKITSTSLVIKDQFNNVLDMRGAWFFIQLEFYDGDYF